jgi:proteasome lid subunit RPN8/RPN11
MFGDDVEQAIREHAMAEYPRESCGVVTAAGYIRLENVSRDPDHTFDCDEQLRPYLAAGTALALVHSHPDGPNAPSPFDMAQQIAQDIPWGLISCTHDGTLAPFFWGDTLEPPPLLGRRFRYGPSGTDGCGDCAALVRDYYRLERGIRIKEFPREDKFWMKPGVSYRDNLLSAGFALADRRTPEMGDVFLAAIQSTVPNHSGIYIGEGKILHHLQNRLSREDPCVVWLKFMTDWFRYSGGVT